jgi:hypothetical protein
MNAARPEGPRLQTPHDESRPRHSPLGWLARKLSGLLRWVAQQLRAPLRPISRLLVLPPVVRHLVTPLRWLGRLLVSGKKRGFGFWWLLATVAIAVALGLVVALLLSPVAGLIALLVVAIWAVVRRRRQRADRESRTTRAPERAPDAQEPAFTSSPSLS